MAAGVAPIEMPSERRGPAARDRPEDRSLLDAQPRMLLEEGVALRVKDIGHLHGRPAHDGGGLRSRRDRGKITSEVMGRLTQSLSGVRVVKTYTAERREDLVFAKGVHRIFRNVAKSLTGVSATSSFASLVIGGITITVMVVGGNAIAGGSMTTGGLFRYIALVAFMTMPIVQIASIGTQVAEAFAGLDRIHEILSTPREDADPARSIGVPDVRGLVEFENVWFEYNPGVPVLKGVTFSAPAGTTTALVGSSGSGKSTLISLVMAFARPKTGRVLVDGHDLTTVKLRDFRGHLGVVLQDNFLFDGTLAQNIAYAKPHASREEIVAVAKIAHCDEFIQEFEQKYDTIVGERGVRLSGGQRQRIAVARALLCDPAILLLDEATSALDAESELAVQQALDRLMHKRTTLVIAHRLATVQKADRIVVIDHGRVVDVGHHTDLVRRGGLYARLAELQFNLSAAAS